MIHCLREILQDKSQLQFRGHVTEALTEIPLAHIEIKLCRGGGGAKDGCPCPPLKQATARHAPNYVGGMGA